MEGRMKSILRKSSVLAVALLLLGGSTARASTIEVNVPFPFLVHGQLLPAGQYLLEREGTDVVIIRGERGTHVGMFVMTMHPGGHDPDGDGPALTFTRGEKEYRLDGIWASGSDGRTIVIR